MATKVKVLNILTGGLRREGITSTQLEFMKRIDRTDVQVDILAVHNNAHDIIEEFRTLGCNVIISPDRKKELPKYLVVLFRLLKKEKYDVVHVHGSSSLLVVELVIAKLAGVPMRIAHSRNTRSENPKLHKFMRPMFDHSYTHAIACGKDAGKWLFGDKPFTVIHNGKDLQRFHFDIHVRENIRKTFRMGNKLVIGYVGNLNDQKNLPFLVDVFAKVHKCQPKSVLYIMGGGAMRESLEKQASSLDIENVVVFTGRITNVHEMLQAMDIMALPSLFEGLPNVVLEWQISGLPCLISDTITRECKVTNQVLFLPIDRGVDVWVDAILATNVGADRTALSDTACRELKAASFDIDENVKFLNEIYINAVEHGENK
ncbi:glycosyltransferase family 1 protein [Desulfosporosinus hippei]|uniref:Glycosyltransferase involved in cell wall bisynthesis n=1 Tax=Desulfosporosinus hippei DSM 8344 TaxID=1121419 RepID=A0A1G8EV50_9FIRM|nr:glycosyltransferase family 1 protein [Desulfosporosinus hippei]SDH73773.1 Glycosyltransferase involved in cell wall bisynthesis [Desulfosporosinus hippei DSM 8344]